MPSSQLRKEHARRLKLRIVAPNLLVIAALGAGCALHEAQVQPQPLFDIPESYSVATPQTPPSTDPWWEALQDPTLALLIDQALDQNFTLAQGLSRIEQAMAIRTRVRALRRPEIGLSGDVERRWTRDLDPEPVKRDVSVDVPPIDLTPETTTKQTTGGSDTSSGSSGGSSGSAPDREQWETQSSIGLDLTWEVDLWGRIRSLTQAESEEVAAAMLDYRALRLSLSSQVALAYYEAMAQRRQLALLQDQLKLARTFLELLELRFVQGDASAVDILQQRSQLAEIETGVPIAQAQLRLLENRLDVLLGVPPDGEDRTTGAMDALSERVDLPSIAVPASLLQQRPDLQALQRRVVAQDYRIGAAMAERLPQLILDGTFGLSDSSDTSLITASGALGLFQPLLDWGRREAQVSIERARLNEALLEFSQAYLTAIEEVETTLWQEARQREFIEALAHREELLTRTVEETRVRYGLGVTDYLPVLTALQDLQQVQRALIDARQTRATLRVQLYRAVGGATTAPPESPGETGEET